ncbi:MAG: hypothetical protein P9M05_09215, partial [Candidatus Stygibacter australis]|nr:hypothetical protein [Candidatus Stygibacter australis]
RYNEYKELFWDNISLSDFDTRREVFELIEGNCKKFSKREIEVLIKKIEMMEKGEYESENDLVYRKKEWLYALQELKDKDVQEKLKKYKELNQEEVVHPSKIEMVRYRSGYDNPIETKDIESKNNLEICNILNKSVDQYPIESLQMTGIQRMFSHFCFLNPQRIIEEINSFINLHNTFQPSLIDGLFEAWKNNKPIDWGIILNYIKDIIDQSEFWNISNEIDQNLVDLFVMHVADFINEGSKNTKNSIDFEYIELAENILIELDKRDYHLFEQTDVVIAVLNSTRGYLYWAMINLSLMKSRDQKPEGKSWLSGIRQVFDDYVNKRKKPSKEFCLSLGRFIQNLIYLDHEWVENNLNNIFSKESFECWKAVYTGYIFYDHYWTKFIYEYLWEKGDYNLALETVFENDSVWVGTIQNICIGYFENIEKMDDPESLINKIISIEKPHFIKEIIRFISSFKPGEKQKVRELWGKLLSELEKNKSMKVNQELIANLSDWLSLVEKIDECVFEWMKKSVRYIKRGFDSVHLIENLLNHVETTPEYVGKIYLELLENNEYPIYKDTDILELIRKIYDGDKEDALHICRIYLSQGYLFVQDLLDELDNKADN